MYKILLIDDEKPVRQAIKALGHFAKLGIDQLYEAVEGEQGLQILREYQPDIVLVDMKMPNMDGVNFLEIACKEYPIVKYIVISGYNDFEYAKQAIKAKVLDYLLKPVIESELNEVLYRAVNELNNDKCQQAEENQKELLQKISLPLAKENLLMMIINNMFTGPLTQEYRSILKLGDNQGKYGVAIFCIINFNEVCRDKFKGDCHIAISEITRIIDELCNDWNQGFSFRDYQTKNEIIQALSIDIIPERTDRWVAIELNKVIYALEKEYGFYTVASLGKFCHNIESLNLSYKNATEILYNVNLLDCKESVFTEYEIDNKRHRLSLLDKKELLIYAFENGNPEYTREIIMDYFNNIQNSGYLSLEYLYKTVREFQVLLENIVIQFKIAGGEEIITSYLADCSMKSFTKLDDFSNAVYHVIEKLFHYIKTDIKASEKKNLYEIKDYIEKHYHQEIKLNLFSDRYYLSKEYLSKLFKEEFDYNIYEYVLKVRMEKACHLLSDPEVKVLTVSERLGYKDNNYFSRAFKTYYGISPTEYREKVLNEHM